jgi:mannitol operon repressor
MTRRKHSVDRSKLEDWQGFYDELNGETSDRAVAIVGTEFLSGHLGQVIECFLIDDAEAHDFLDSKNPFAPLGSFGARIKAAYCLGLISQDEYHDLKIIKGIRNSFAHGLHGLSFLAPDIQSECEKLKYPQKAMAKRLPQSARVQFTIAVALLLSAMAMRSLEVNIKNQRCSVRPESKVTRLEFCGSEPSS